MSTTDTTVGLYAHVTSGETYILRWASLWDNNDCVGATVTECYGSLDADDKNALYVDREIGALRDDWASTAGNILANQNGAERDDAEWANVQGWRLVHE